MTINSRGDQTQSAEKNLKNMHRVMVLLILFNLLMMVILSLRFGRPGLVQIMDEIKAGNVDVLVINKNGEEEEDRREEDLFYDKEKS